MTFARAQLDEILHRLFIDAPATSLRDEDRRKSDEMAGLLVEVEAAVPDGQRSASWSWWMRRQARPMWASSPRS